MPSFLRFAAVLPALALGACAVMDRPATPVATAQPVVTAPVQTLAPPTTPPPSATIATAASVTDVSSFVDPTAYGQLSAKSRSAASEAQFGALQFGRVGAPRDWVGDKGVTGSITVGPYVRVNAIDCRDFTNSVTISGKSFVKKGTACREATGGWSVTPGKAA